MTDIAAIKKIQYAKSASISMWKKKLKTAASVERQQEITNKINEHKAVQNLCKARIKELQEHAS